MSHDPWLELADIYATGALDGQELSRFEGHLASGCNLCESHLRETEEALSVLSRALPRLEPSAALKVSVLRQIDADSSATVIEFSRQRRFGQSLAAAFALAAFVIGVNWNNQSVQRNVMRFEGMMTMAREPKARVIELKGLEASPLAKGQLVWNPAKCQGIFFSSNLPVLPEGKVYELWAIAAGKPVAAGTFAVDKSGRGMLRCSAHTMENFDQFAVTLEPAGGLSAPSGPMHLVGSLSP